jgi:hypothetical protein
MSARNAPQCQRMSAGRAVVLAALALAASGGFARAQAPAEPAAPSRVINATAVRPDGSSAEITLAGCTGCGLPGGGAPYNPGPGVYGWGHKYGPPPCDLGCVDEGCGEAGCHAGYFGCDPCEGQHRFTRLFCAFHNALCCPDPCYEPRWVDAANAALFVPSVRPFTYSRLRWDHGRNLTDPDRAEYFWAAIGKNGPGQPERSVDYNELSLYAEMGGPKFSLYINTPYRNQEGEVNRGSGGFGDLTIGTKTVLIDSELMLFTFSLGTTIPTGLSGRGIGTGHVSMDPSLLYAVKLYPETYWQGQLGYWIPIGGTSGFPGSVLFYHNSINHVIARPLKDTALIGTIETSGFTFTSGSFTDVNGVVRSANDTTYFAVGPGLRLALCDKLDFGFGVQFSVTGNHFAEQLYRTEIRWRF